MIAKVAPTNSTALICGETGTGKELVARAVHDQSLRTEMPFVPINCGALPENLIESGLFGHRKGAFTGAEEHRTGLFQVANGGTLFLDEIGELPKSMQAKLLRFLESGEIRRVGDNDSLICDVRVVCATNRHLDQMVAAGDFREDLWFRINTFEIDLPPLRERVDDILPLARHLVTRKGMRLGSEDELFTPETAAALQQHTWPGNVRELANVVEHAMILCEQAPIRLEHLPRRFAVRPAAATAARHLAACHDAAAAAPAAKHRPPDLRQREMQTILDAFDRHGGNKPKAAEELGISLKTLYNKLNQAAALEKTGLTHSIFRTHTHHDAQHLCIADVDRPHVGVGGLQADAVLSGNQRLQRGFAFVGNGHDDLAFSRRALAADDHIVAVGNLVFDHRLAVDLQHEEVFVGGSNMVCEIDALVLLDRFVEHAGGDLPRKRQAAVLDRFGRQLDRPRHIRLAGNEPLFLQGLQVADHAVGRAMSKFAPISRTVDHSRDCESCRE